MRATKSLTSAAYVAKRLSRHLMDVMRYGRGMTLTNGNALAGRLAKSALDLKIPLWLSSPVRELVVEDGAVRGAIIERDGRLVRVNAKRGVVLCLRRLSARRRAAPGDVPARADRATSIGRPARPATPAMACGWRKPPVAASRTTLPNAAAWVPVSITERKDGSRGVMPHFIDRAKPGVIAVTRAGVRFANEGQFLPRFCSGHGEGPQAGRGDHAF